MKKDPERLSNSLKILGNKIKKPGFETQGLSPSAMVLLPSSVLTTGAYTSDQGGQTYCFKLGLVALSTTGLRRWEPGS